MGKTTQLRVKTAGKLAGTPDLQVLIYPVKDALGEWPPVFTLQMYYNYIYFGMSVYNQGTGAWESGTPLTTNFVKAQILNSVGGVLTEITPPADISTLASGEFKEVYRPYRDTDGNTFPLQLASGDYTFVLTLDPNNTWGQYKQYSLDFAIVGEFVGFNELFIKGSGLLAPR